MGKKSSAVEMGKRVEEVLRIIIDGAQHHDVVEFAAGKGWGITDRQVREYVRRADELLVERREKNRKRLLARHTARREALFARAINAADLRTALAVVDSLAKLQGLFTDPKDLQELARLAASQGERLRELEERLSELAAIRKLLLQQARRLEQLEGQIQGRRLNLLATGRTPAQLMVDAGFAPDPWQAEFLQSGDERNLVLCARQIGKSLAVSMLALATVLTRPGSLTVIVAQRQDQAAEMLRKSVTAFHKIGSPATVNRSGETHFELTTGARILALPGEERAMHGPTADLLIIDEASRVPDAVFHAASPQLSASKGRLVALSTAFAKSGWFYREWCEGTGYRKWSITARECPRHTPEFLERERRSMGDRWFAMSYLNQFGDAVAAVFSSEDIKHARTADVQPLFTPSAAPSKATGTDSPVKPLFGAKS